MDGGGDVTGERLRVLIVDDEPPARENLRILLAAAADVELVGECPDGEQAVRAILEQEPDLVFLDVQMPGLDGFEVVRRVGPSRMPAVVFVTAYDRYALRAFEVAAVDYLLKPFADERFTEALDRARRALRRRRDAELGRRLITLLRAHGEHAGSPAAEGPRDPESAGTRPEGPEALTVRARGRVRVLPVDEIDWIEAAGDYARIHAGERTWLVSETMRSLAERLRPRRFLRIHRSTIVNLRRIRELQPEFHGDWVVVLDDGTRLRVSRTRREGLERALGTSL